MAFNGLNDEGFGRCLDFTCLPHLSSPEARRLFMCLNYVQISFNAYYFGIICSRRLALTSDLTCQPPENT